MTSNGPAGAAGTEVAPFAPGSTIESYEIVAALTDGPVGPRYEASDTRDGRGVVVNVVGDMLLHCGEEALRGFLEEVRRAVTVRHSNLVHVLRAGRTGGKLWVAVEDTEGMTCVAEDVAVNGPMTPYEATRIIRDTAAAVGALHAGLITHRDIKPEHIWVGAGGEVKLSGAGFTRASEELQQFKLGLPVATPAYCAPELYKDNEADPRTDVYALGAVYFHLLTGGPPFLADTSLQVLHKHVTERVPDPRDLNAAVPDAAAEVVLKAMAKKAADRHADVAAFIAGLEDVLAGLPREGTMRTALSASQSGIVSAGRLKEAMGGTGSGILTPAQSGVRNIGARASSSGVRSGIREPSGLKNAPVARTNGEPSGIRESAARSQVRTLTATTIPAPSSGGGGKLLVAGLLVAGLAAVGVGVAMTLKGNDDGTTDPALKKKVAPGGETVVRKDDDDPGPPGRNDPGPEDPGGTVPIVTTAPEWNIPDVPAEPPAAEVVRLVSPGLPGWAATGAWSTEGNPVSAAGNSGEGIARLNAAIPSASFDLHVRLSVKGGSSAGIEFHHRGPRHLLLRFDDRNTLRLFSSDGPENTSLQQLHPEVHVAPGPEVSLRLVAEHGEAAVFVEGKRVLRAHCPKPGDEAPRISLASMKGRAEFAGLLWAARGKDPVDLRRQTLRAAEMFADPDLLARVDKTLADRAAFGTVVNDCIATLGRIIDRAGAADRLLALAADDALPPDTLRLAVSQLPRKPDAKVAETARKRLAHTDAGVRLSAVKLVAAVQPGDENVLVPLIKDNDKAVMTAAMEALVDIGTPTALGHLHRNLWDGRLRQAACLSLMRLGDRPGGAEGLLAGIADAGAGGEVFRKAWREEQEKWLRPVAVEGAAGRLTPERIAGMSRANAGKNRRWMLAGPWGYDDKNQEADHVGREAFLRDPDFTRRYTGHHNKQFTWMPWEADKDDKIDLQKAFGTGDKVTVFGHTVIHRRADEEHEVQVTVDDWVVFWLNGQRHGPVQHNRGIAYKLKFRRGPNTIFFVADNRGGQGWWLSMKLPDSEPPPEISSPAVITLLDEDNTVFHRLRGKDGKEFKVNRDDKTAWRGRYSIKWESNGGGNADLTGWSLPIRAEPRPGEFRYLRLAWKKGGPGGPAAIQFAHDKKFPDAGDGRGAFRLSAGEVAGKPSVRVADDLKPAWTLTTVDLFETFGARNITGMRVEFEGETVFIDRMRLGRSIADLDAADAADDPAMPETFRKAR